MKNILLLLILVTAAGFAEAQNISEQEKALREDRLTYSLEADTASPRPGQSVTLTIKAQIVVPFDPENPTPPNAFESNMVSTETSTYHPENWRIVTGPGTLIAFGGSPIVRNYATPNKVDKNQNVTISVDLVSQYPNKPKFVLLKTLFLADRKEYRAAVRYRAAYSLFDQVDDTESSRSANGISTRTSKQTTTEKAVFQGGGSTRVFKVDEYSVSSGAMENQSTVGGFVRSYVAKIDERRPLNEWSKESYVSKDTGSMTGGNVSIGFGDQGFDLRSIGVEFDGIGTATLSMSSEASNAKPSKDDDCKLSRFASDGCRSRFEKSVGASLASDRYGLPKDSAQFMNPEQYKAISAESWMTDLKITGSAKEGRWLAVLTGRYEPKSQQESIADDSHGRQHHHIETWVVILTVTLEAKEPDQDKPGSN